MVIYVAEQVLHGVASPLLHIHHPFLSLTLSSYKLQSGCVDGCWDMFPVGKYLGHYRTQSIGLVQPFLL